MRSSQEIAFRLRQEGGNLLRLLHAPHVECAKKPPLSVLPEPGAVAKSLAGSAYAADVVQSAEKILQHRFFIMGIEIDTGPTINWRQDYVNEKSSEVDYFRWMPYLDFNQVGDHKVIWELNRHQHLVLLAQAWRFTGRVEFLREIEAELESWWGANPFAHGINWTSALEVAFRAFSWIWVFHIAGDGLSDSTRRKLLDSLYAHGRHLAGNLSVYFSPNTHLMGEAMVLHAIAVLFPEFPRSRRWRREAGDMVRAQMQAQVQSDGSHFEQSTYYHVYALDMLLFSAVIETMPPDYLAGLARMAEYLDAVLGPQRRLPFFGDDDGGRLFHPYGLRERFGNGTLAMYTGMGDTSEVGAWWLGPRRFGDLPKRQGARVFENSGLAVIENGDLHLVFDAGPFGYGRGGHSHSDTLSFVLRRGDEDLLIDAGTYTYVGDPKWRNWFRGSAAHNTIRIDGLDQADPENPFRWGEKPAVERIAWKESADEIFLAAICRYRGFEHLRRIVYLKPSLIVVVDEVTGPPGDHLVEQFWHSGETVTEITPRRFRLGNVAQLILSNAGELSTGGDNGWRSRALCAKEPAAVVRVAARGQFPMRFTAAIDLDGNVNSAVISAAFQQLGVEPGSALG